jgi:hypothetical protein
MAGRGARQRQQEARSAERARIQFRLQIGNEAETWSLTTLRGLVKLLDRVEVIEKRLEVPVTEEQG